MVILDKFICLYSYLYNRKGIHPYVLTPVRRLVRSLARIFIPDYFNMPIVYSNKQSDVIVSFTSFPARIGQVYQVIQSLLRQSVLPKKIILWLSKEQFKDIELPLSLVSLQNDIFTIKMVDGDIRSHKKYYYVLQEYPDNPILLIDDDLYYPSDMIEKMLEALVKHPNSIICRYGSIAKYNNGKLLPYNDWWDEVPGTCDDPNFFFGTGGGTLLSRNLLYDDVLNIDLAQKLTPIADDVWINAMANLANTPKYKIKFGLILPIWNSQEEKLSAENVTNGLNDVQLNNIIGHYEKKLGINPFADKTVR